MSIKRARARAATHGFWMLSGLFAFALGMAPGRTASREAESQQQVEFFGHTAIRETPEGRTLMFAEGARETLFVPNRACEYLEVREGAETVKAGRFAVQGGCQLRDIEGTRQEKTTLAVVDIRSGNALWQMPVDRSNPRFLEWRRKVSENRTARDLEMLLPELRRMRAEAVEPLLVMDLAYAIALAEMKMGEREIAIRELALTSQAAKVAHFPSIAYEASYRRADLLIKATMHDEARAILTQMADWGTSGDSRTNTYLDLERSLIARAESRWDDAVSLMDAAMMKFERTHDVVMQRIVAPVFATILLKVERKGEAERLIGTLDSLLEGADECASATFLNNTAILGLNIARQLAVSGQISKIGPYRIGSSTIESLFDRALLHRSRCKDDTQLANLYSGLAFLAFYDKDYSGAKNWLTRIREIRGIDRIDQLENQDIEAQVALATGNVEESLRLFEQLEVDASKQPSPYRRKFECKAIVGRLESSIELRTRGAFVAAAQSCLLNGGNPISAAELGQLAKRLRQVGVTLTQ